MGRRRVIECRRIEPKGPLYAAEIELRDKVLRGPVGRSRHAEDFDRDRAGIHFIAIDDGRVVGCLGLYPLAEGALEMRHVAVDEASRGRGVGAALCRFAVDWALAQGVRQIELGGRTSAQGFYEACGFIVTGPEYEKHRIAHRKFVRSLQETPA